MHTTLLQQYTQDNYNNTQGQTNNNYTQDKLKLAAIHARQIRIQMFLQRSMPSNVDIMTDDNLSMAASRLRAKCFLV